MNYIDKKQKKSATNNHVREKCAVANDDIITTINSRMC